MAQSADFENRMNATLAPVDETAPFVQCAGVFQAFRALAGADSDIGRAALSREVDMAILATLVRQDETGADDEAVMDEIHPLIAAAAELYLDRFVANQTASGEVMDEGLTATLQVCSELRLRFLEGSQ